MNLVREAAAIVIRNFGDLQINTAAQSEVQAAGNGRAGNERRSVSAEDGAVINGHYEQRS